MSTPISLLSGSFTTYALGNLLVVVDVTDTSMAGSGTDKKITISQLFSNYVFGASGSLHSAGAVPDPGSTPGTTRYLREDASWQSPVTSVTFTGDGTVLSSTPSSAVTSSGTLTASLLTQPANRVLAGPTTGSAASPTFRALVATDLPSITATGSTTARSLADRFASVFRVKDYGAAGDGTTDDTVAIQAAMDAASSGKGVVVFDRTTSYYRVTGRLFLYTSCYGENFPEIRMDMGTGSGTHQVIAVNAYTGDGLIIQGLHINGQWNGTAVNFSGDEFDACIYLGNSSNVTIRDCFLENPFGDCISLSMIAARSARDGITHTGFCSNILIENCVLNNPRRCNIAVISCKKAEISNCNMQKTEIYVSAIDLEVDPNGNLSPYQFISDISIHDCLYNGQDVWLKAYNPNSNQTLDRISVCNNTVITPNVAIETTGAANVNGLAIEGNRFTSAMTAAYTLYILNVIGYVSICGNSDTTDSTLGWFFQGIPGGGNFSDNAIIPQTSNRTIGMTFSEGCAACVIAGNNFVNVYSQSGTLVITGTSTAPTNHMISGNNIIGSRNGIVIGGPVGVNNMIDGNRIESDLHCVIATNLSTGNIITTGNVLIGAGNLQNVFGMVIPGAGQFQIRRTHSGTDANNYWGVQIQNQGASDNVILGVGSSALGTTLAWVGNSKQFLYYPSSGQFRIGTTTTAAGLSAVFDTNGRLGLFGADPPSYGLHQVGGSHRLQAMSTPGAPTVTPSGTPGNTTYTYFIVAIDKAGNKTLASSGGSTSTGNATLTTSNFNVVSWTAVPGAASYDVLLGDTAHSVSLAVVGTSYSDKSGSTSAYTAPTRNATADSTIDGTLTVGTLSSPVFGASGTGHSIGLVPDPGSSAGTTRFLREDATWQAGGGGGTVTSITFTGDGTVLSSTPSSAVTTSGTVTASLNTQSANLFLAGPTSGSAVAPTFRSLVANDLPSTINPTTIAAGSDVAVAILKANSTQTHDLLTVESSTPAVKGGINSNYNLYGAIASDVITGRLTLSSTLPIADVTTGTTIYYLPFSGRGFITLYNTTASQYENWLIGTSGVSLALSTSANTLYDVFIYNNAGTLTLETVAWTNSGVGTSARATAIVFDGDYIYKSGAQGRRYLGTIYCSATNTTKDTTSARLVWNVANRVTKAVGSSTVPSPNPFQIANGSTTSSFVWATISDSGGANPIQIPLVSGLDSLTSYWMTLACPVGSTDMNVGTDYLALKASLNSQTPSDGFTSWFVSSITSAFTFPLANSSAGTVSIGYNLVYASAAMYSALTSKHGNFYGNVAFSGVYQC